MRKAILSSAIALVTVCGGVCTAQVSTFPAPPPLPPPTKNVSSEATNSSSIQPPYPDSGTSSQGTANPNPVGPASDLTPSGVPPANTPANSSPVPVTAATLTSMTALDDKVTLGPGDHISFRVIEDRDDAVPRMVTDTGEVEFPYIGRVRVQGLTCRQLAVQLKRLYEVDYYKSATVIIGLDVIASHQTLAAPKEVAWVIGQVHQVGPQELSPVQPMTVSQIILRAGGFGDFADQRKVKVIHKAALTSSQNATESPSDVTDSGQESQIVDVKAVFEGHSTVDPVVKPNDYIIVPKRLINL